MRKLSVRKTLPHQAPLWVDFSKADFFITICCKQRGKNQLAYRRVANLLFETIKHRNAAGVWYVHLALLMPDHLHLLVSFPQTDKRVQTVVSKWKEWTTKTLKISWQRDFFEHRLRQEESLSEKADYILLNPVRADLVESAEDWPYIFIPEPW